MAAEREQIVRLLADEPNWATADDFLRAVKAVGLHLVTDADLRVLDIMSTLKIKMCVGEWMISDARELELCKAELARRGDGGKRGS